MLGDLVAVDFEALPGATVCKGDTLGQIEGFKAVSDLFCIGMGVFEGPNPALAQGVGVLEQDPYGDGWLYELSGAPEPGWLDATAYRELLGIPTLPCPDPKTP
jgi:glycine cleavage system H protein